MLFCRAYPATNRSIDQINHHSVTHTHSLDRLIDRLKYPIAVHALLYYYEIWLRNCYKNNSFVVLYIFAGANNIKFNQETVGSNPSLFVTGVGAVCVSHRKIVFEVRDLEEQFLKLSILPAPCSYPKIRTARLVCSLSSFWFLSMFSYDLNLIYPRELLSPQ